MIIKYENTEGAVCYVKILDKYLEKIPEEAIEADNFYLTPVSNQSTDESMLWFTKVPVRKNTLS